MFSVLKAILKFFRDLFYAISIISISVLGILNITGVYKYAIDKYELTKYTGLSAEVLMDNYKRTIYYVQNPLIKELKFNSLSMSEFGRIHFFEVKRIFIALYVFSLVFIITMVIKVLTNKHNKIGKELIKNLNRSVNIMVIIVLSVLAAALIDFPRAFYYFHKIFFRNNYWIFDPATDPIINALPEEFFMLELILIIAVLVATTMIIKGIHFRNILAAKKKK